MRISQNHQAPGARNRDDREGPNALIRLGVCHPAGAFEQSRETGAWAGICAACSSESGPLCGEQTEHPAWWPWAVRVENTAVCLTAHGGRKEKT